ncbi:MAG: hypothetical protein WAN51_09820, partial [Alphaproteobacteria bacterium]
MRLLLGTVFAAALMLTVRLADLWQGLSEIAGSVSIAQSQAAEPKTDQPDSKSAAAKPGDTKPADTMAADTKPAPNAADAKNDRPAASPPSSGGAGAPSDAAGASPAAATAPSDTAASPPNANSSTGPDAAAGADGKAAAKTKKAPEDEFSDAEVKTLQELSQRREALDKREQDLDTRDGMLAAGEKRLDEKIGELKDLQGKIQGLLKTYNDQENSKLKSLVKIYENMKPKDAAPIFEQLDMDTLLDIVERMK